MLGRHLGPSWLIQGPSWRTRDDHDLSWRWLALALALALAGAGAGWRALVGWRKVDGETADDKTYEGLVSTRLACIRDVFAQLVGQRAQRL